MVVAKKSMGVSSLSFISEVSFSVAWQILTSDFSSKVFAGMKEHKIQMAVSIVVLFCLMIPVYLYTQAREICIKER